MAGNIVVLKDDTLILCYTDGGIATHVSRDKGRTWGDQKMLVPNPAPPSRRGYYCHPSLLRLKNGEILLSYIYSVYPPVNKLPYYGHNYYRRSADEGETWSEQFCMTPTTQYMICHNDKVRQLSTGRILAMTEHWKHIGGDDHAGYVSTAYYSDDDGYTWLRSDNEVDLYPVEAQEPPVVELRDGRLMVVCRSYSGYPVRAFSSDGGKTNQPRVDEVQVDPLDLAVRSRPKADVVAGVTRQVSKGEPAGLGVDFDEIVVGQLDPRIPVRRVGGRPVADGLDRNVAVQDPLRAPDGSGAAPAGGVGRPQASAHEFQALESPAAAEHEVHRLIEQQKVHPRRLRLHPLVRFGRHLGIRAPVDQEDISRAKPRGRLHAIHGHRSAADDGHRPAGDPLGHLAEAAVPQGRQVIDRGVDIWQRAGLGLETFCGPEAGSQEDRAEALLEKIFRPGRAINRMAALEPDPERFNVLNLIPQKIQAEAVGDDPVAQHAAGLGPGLENGDRAAALGELGRAAQPGRSGAHDGDGLALRSMLLEGFETDLPGVLHQKALDLADRNRAVGALRAGP